MCAGFEQAVLKSSAGVNQNLFSAWFVLCLLLLHCRINAADGV